MSSLEGEEWQKALDNNDTDTKRKICYTVSFPESNCRSPPNRRAATMGADAAVSIQKRGGVVRNDDVEQSLKDPIPADIGPRPQSRAECWSGQTLKVTGASPLTNKEAHSRSYIKADKRDGPCSKNVTLFAGPSIYEIGCCNLSNDDSQEEDVGKKAEETRDLKRQVNPYDWVGSVENYDYLP